MTNEQSDRIDPCEVIPPNNNDSISRPTDSGTRPPGEVAELGAVAAVAELADLAARVDRLETILAAYRRVYADLVAACRAALTAHADGEPDPLWYLRDQLPVVPPGHPLSETRGAGGGR
ncbi:hypothetical protein K1W54_27330 [Micromonospora sp. CPCC 205371]|nr:hypothetical protein [Micromonospora sp. CPCC 205371]